MINNQNIQKYISYLYKRKTGNEIPSDVLSSWSGLEDDEVTQHLIELYTSWNIGINDAKMMENEFLTKVNKPKPVIPLINEVQNSRLQSEPVVAQINSTPATKKKFWRPLYWWISAGLLLIIVTTLINQNLSENEITTVSEPVPVQQPTYQTPPTLSQPVIEPVRPTNTPTTSEYEPSVKVGIVQTSTEGFLGTKNRDRVIKQLEKKARKLHPGYSRLENFRYDGETAIADVMVDP